MAFERKYSDEVRQAAVQRVVDRRKDEPGNRSILREVAEEFEVGEQSLRIWVKRLDDGVFQAGTVSQDDGERLRLPVTKQSLLQRIAELEQELADVRDENEVLKKAAAIFAAEIARH